MTLHALQPRDDLASYLAMFSLGELGAAAKKPVAKAAPAKSAKPAARAAAKPAARKASAVAPAAPAPASMTAAPPSSGRLSSPPKQGMGLQQLQVLAQVLQLWGAKVTAKTPYAQLAKAWSSEAKKRKLDASVENSSGGYAWVMASTYNALAAGPTAAAAQPAASSPAGGEKLSVADAQAILARLGEKVSQDGKYGPKTAAAWTKRAKAAVGTENAAFARESSTVARVSAKALEALRAQAATNPTSPAAATKPKPATAAAAPAAGTSRIAVKTAQELLNRLGAKLKADGKFGPATAKAWGQRAGKAAGAAQAFFKRVDGSTAEVSPAAVEALTKQAGVTPTNTPAPVAPDSPTAQGGRASIAVQTAQELLIQLGVKVSADGKFGPKTAKAWSAAAANAVGKKLAFFERASATTASVSQAAVDALTKQAGTSAVRPSTGNAPAASKTKIAVVTAQELLVRLGAKLKADGKYGPATSKAWSAAAARAVGKSQAFFERVNGTTASVSQAAVDALTKQAGVAATNTPVPADATKPEASARVKIRVGTAQDLLKRLGATVARDGKFGAKTAKAWTDAAKSLVDASQAFFERVNGTTARVSQAAVDALTKRAGVAPANDGVPVDAREGGASTDATTDAPPSSSGGAAPSAGGDDSAPAAPAPSGDSAVDGAAKQLVQQCTAQLDVATVQAALLAVNETPVAKGTLSDVSETGTWDQPTQTGFFAVLGIKPPYTDVWIAALPSLLSSDRSTIRLLPKQAESLKPAAAAWTSRKGAGAPAPAADAPSAGGSAPAPSSGGEASAPGAGGGYAPAPSAGGGYAPQPGSDAPSSGGGYAPQPSAGGGYAPSPGGDGGYAPAPSAGGAIVPAEGDSAAAQPPVSQELAPGGAPSSKGPLILGVVGVGALVYLAIKRKRGAA